ncbi:MAG: glycoside hydrolase family 88 protein, partial [Bacteroidota bacterium]
LLAGVNGDHYLKFIDLKTRAITNLAYLGPGNIDGIQETADGLLVSHFLGNLYHIDAQNKVRELLNTRDQNLFIADFAYLPTQQRLVIPSLRTHKVYLYEYGSEAPTPSATTWVDSVDHYARTAFLPAKKYQWSWQHAALLRAMTHQYEQKIGADPRIYLDYVKTAMDKTMGPSHAGRNPNAVASGFGLAWLGRVTGDLRYKKKAELLYLKYLEIPRAENGGVTHLRRYKELWDDTVFMVGIYLLEMYLLTEDEKYLDELLLQIEAHREKLRVEKWGLWVHGWDGDDKNHCRLCSQKNWSKNPGQRSTEIWGRGNGWVVVTLTEIVKSVPKSHPKWATFAGYLKEMLEHLPELQDAETGHWFQLPVYPHEEGNYIESSCTAMFGYGIAGALKLGIVEGEAFQKSVERAYHGLRKHSVQEKGEGYLSTKNICKGTCIGDKEYYFNRGAKGEKPFGLGMFILFGRTY